MRACCIKYSKMFRKRRLRTLENMYYHSESSFPYELSINLKLEKFSKNTILGRINIVNVVRMDKTRCIICLWERNRTELVIYRETTKFAFTVSGAVDEDLRGKNGRRTNKERSRLGNEN